MQDLQMVNRLEDGTYSGLLVDVLESVSEAFNLRVEYSEPSDGEWGVLGEDGGWSGIVGVLVEGGADVVKKVEICHFPQTFFGALHLIVAAIKGPI